MIEFYNVDLDIDNKPILRAISLRIVKGEFVYLAGPSGAGKSSVLRLIYMDNFPTRGIVVVEKFSSQKIKQKMIPYLRRQTGVVFQDFKLLPDRTAYDNVSLAMRVVGAKKSEIKRSVWLALAEVNLGSKRDHYPRELSGGEQQRTAIARAIVNQPVIILADEPTGNLDAENSREVIETLQKINQHGTAVLMATHNEKLIKEYPHRVIRLKDGMLI
jgi:cell division transport system ATP-binding protein